MKRTEQIMAKKIKVDEPKSKDAKTHIKPTPEELQEAMDKGLEEVEEIEKQDEEKLKKVAEKVEPSEEEKEEEAPAPSPDYKEKFIESSKESQILHHKNKKTQESLSNAMGTPEPSDKELEAEYTDWEVMSDFEKKMAKQNSWNTKKLSKLDEISKDNKSVEEWIGKVDNYTDDPQTTIDYPELDGKEAEFKLFASKPTRRGVEFSVLVSAFLHDASKAMPPKQKGKMFDQGSGGTPPKVQNKSNKLTVTQGRSLMKTNYKKYSELLRAGRIESGI